MADSRTLKLTFLGDVSNLSQSLKTAETQTDTFGTKMGDIGKKVGVAMAAAAAAVGAYAIKLGVDSVKAAIEDEAAARKLEQTLKNVTGATKAQVKAVEDYITKTALRTGIEDDQLRPAMARLVRSTEDATKAQDLLNIALDVASATGKPLEAVANSLGKAYDGNANALGRLGLGIDSATLKSGDFNKITEELQKRFRGFADNEANTFEGKIRRLSLAWDEAKETVGSYIIDALTPLLDVSVNKIIPAVSNVADSLGRTLGPAFAEVATFVRETLLPVLQGWWSFLTETMWPGITKTLKPVLEGLGKAFDTISSAVKNNAEKLEPLFNLLKTIAEFIVKTLAPVLGTVLGAALQVAGAAIGKVIEGIAKVVEVVAKAIEKAVNLAIDGINLLIRGWNMIPDWMKPGGTVDYIKPVNFYSKSDGSTASSDPSGYGAQLDKILGNTSGTKTTVPGVTTTTSSTKTSSTTATDSGMTDAQLAKEYQTTFDAINAGATATVTYINKSLDAIMTEIAALKNTPTTVVVQGTLLDPEGTARAIETTLYQSQQRTGYLGELMV